MLTVSFVLLLNVSSMNNYVFINLVKFLFDSDSIKQKAEIELGLMTQVILSKNLPKRDSLINVAMKINLKMMGTNSKLQFQSQA